MRLTSTVAVCVGLFSAASAARADDFIVYSPHVLASQSEVELRGYRYADSRSDLGGSAAELSIAYGVNEWWKPEFYAAEYEKTPDTRGYFKGFEFENTFQLTPPGKYVADFGFLASYEHNIAAGLVNAVEFGPLIEKTAGRFTHRANLIWEKEVGSGAGGKYEFRYSYSGTYTVSQAFRPGLEAYGRPGDHAYQAGPIVAGEHHIPGTTGSLEYRAGMVAGINTAAPRQTWLLQLEYEFF
jgi:hypothetical protein